VKIVFLDIDGTLTEVSSPWQDIHEHYQLWDTVGLQIAESWLNGQISYDQFCHKDVELWNNLGLRLQDIHARFDSYKVRPEAYAAINRLHSLDYRIVLLSSGFSYIGKRILKGCSNPGCATVVANDLFTDTATGLISVKVQVSGDLQSKRSKAGHVNRYCKKHGIPAAEAVAIGDGPSDQHMFDSCGRSFLVKNGSELLEAVENISLTSQTALRTK
jgi:phosphoserine phosphatase